MKLMVLDGNSLINRAYYGIRPLTTRDGLYTHAVYGFLTTLLRLTEEEKPEAAESPDPKAPRSRNRRRKPRLQTQDAAPEQAKPAPQEAAAKPEASGDRPRRRPNHRRRKPRPAGDGQ